MEGWGGVRGTEGQELMEQRCRCGGWRRDEGEGEGAGEKGRGRKKKGGEAAME